MPYFVDCHPTYQSHLDFTHVKRLGYVAAICKVSEGASYVPPGLKAYFAKIERAGLIAGAYHFLDDSPGDRQAEHFVRTVQGLGGAEGRLLVADFEEYGEKTPTNRVLKDFVGGVKRRTNDHAVICYSGYGFWNSGTPSGGARDYRIDATWDARYADSERHDYPRTYWRRVKGWYESQPKWGGMEPIACQFTSAGRVDGHYMDVNVLFGGKADLLKLATRAPAAKPEPDQPQKPDATRLERNIEAVRDYGPALLEYRPKYWCWDGGSLDRNVAGRPACVDAPPPPMREIDKMFCADLITLMLRTLGKPVPKNGIYPGGTRSFKLKYGSVMRPFRLSELRRGDVPFVDFQNPHAPEGHIGFCLGDGPDGLLLQSYADSCATLEPGLNRIWTVEGSHAGHYYTHVIPREKYGGERGKARLEHP